MLLTGLISLCLTACASSPVKDAPPATDLTVLVLGVEALTQERTPASTVQRAEDAETTGELFQYTLALEEVEWLHEQDKERTRQFVRESVRVIQRNRQPVCRWWNLSCRLRK